MYLLPRRMLYQLMQSPWTRHLKPAFFPVMACILLAGHASGQTLTRIMPPGDSITRSPDCWRAAVTGNTLYSASNFGWSRTLQPGQSVEFDFQGTQYSSAADIPLLRGAVCD